MYLFVDRHLMGKINKNPKSSFIYTNILIVHKSINLYINFIVYILSLLKYILFLCSDNTHHGEKV